MVWMKYRNKNVLEIIIGIIIIIIIDCNLVLHFKAYIIFTEKFYFHF